MNDSIPVLMTKKHVAGDSPMSHEKISRYLSAELKNTPLYIYPTVDSTNNKAKQLTKEAQVPHGTAVLALHQSQGKGRLGRSFSSPANTGVYMSLILKPAFDMSRALLVTTAASVAVARAIEKICGQAAEIKWVNDVLIDGKKVCGILTEAVTDSSTGKLAYLILGIGINCSEAALPEELRSVAGAVNGDVDRNHLAAEVINQVMPLVNHLQDRSFIQEYRERSFLIGKMIKVYKGGYSETGYAQSARALDIDENGGLMVLYSSGEREILSSGEVSIRREEA